MIHIKKISNKTGRAVKKTLELAQAKNLIGNLTQQDFKYSKYIVLGSDKNEEETTTLIASFPPLCFVKKQIEDDGFSYEVYEVQYVKKTDMKRAGISETSVLNFIKKIRESITEITGIDVKYNDDTFDLTVDTAEFTLILIVSYELEILKTLQGASKENTDVMRSNTVRKRINAIFKKQRYYYRKKAQKND